MIVVRARRPTSPLTTGDWTQRHTTPSSDATLPCSVHTWPAATRLVSVSLLYFTYLLNTSQGVSVSDQLFVCICVQHPAF